MNVMQWVHRHVHALPEAERNKVIEEVSASASPGFDFFLLVVLSCSIATLGLVTNSPAVIIGAMLVAPLMSPIIGLGLASMTGNDKLAETSLSAILRGAALAILLSTIMTVINRNLPFVVLQELPTEILARTRPSPIDLVIALSGGLAASYAMTRPNLSAALPGVAIATALMPPLCTIGIGIALERWDVAGGASLLFITNTITIAFAAALVFFMRGFAPRRGIKNHLVSRTLMISALLTIALLVPLSLYSVKFFNEANENRRINEVVRAEIERIEGVELAELNVQRTQTGLSMILTVRTNTPLHYEQVVALQKAIVDDLQEPASLKVNQIFAERLDPLIPPTFTPTPTLAPTNTPGPSATPTRKPTSTPTLTPTPAVVQIVSGALPKLNLYQVPAGPVIGQIRIGQTLTMLYGHQEADGFIWLQVMDQEGRIGWIPEIYIKQITPTPNE